MKFIHIADLHIGKRVNEFDLSREQEFALDQVVECAVRHRADAVVIAGDVFDKPLPSLEALRLAERFLGRLADEGLTVIMIAGNHDSAERLSFGAPFRTGGNLHIARAFDAQPQYVDLADAQGVTARFHLLPFIKPIMVKLAYPDQAESLADYNDAVRYALSRQPMLPDAPNILVAHQFVVDGAQGPDVCDSETVSVGGVDSVEASLFDAFDYVALGHLHGRQRIRRPQVRYAGTPYPYSFSEAHQKKTLTIVEVDGPGSVAISEEPLALLHAFREVTGSYDELRECVPADASREDYLHVTLTDAYLMDAMQKLRALYPNIMKLDFAQDAQRQVPRAGDGARAVAQKTPQQLFADYFAVQAGHDLQDEQAALVDALLGDGDAL